MPNQQPAGTSSLTIPIHTSVPPTSLIQVINPAGATKPDYPAPRDARTSIAEYIQAWKWHFHELLRHSLSFKRMDLELREWSRNKTTTLAVHLMSRSLILFHEMSVSAQAESIIEEADEYMLALESTIGSPPGLYTQTRQARFDLVSDDLEAALRAARDYQLAFSKVRRERADKVPYIVDSSTGACLHRGTSPSWTVYVTLDIKCEEVHPVSNGTSQDTKYRHVYKGHISDGVENFPFETTFLDNDEKFVAKPHMLFARAFLLRRAYHIP